MAPTNSTITQPKDAHVALNNLLASSAAALCSRLCTHPLDTIKTRIQVSNSHQGLIPTFVELVRVRGLYRGLPIALALSVPGLSVYLTTYDLAKDRLSRQFESFGTDTVRNHMMSGMIAEVCSGLFWTPMEILKSKQQVEHMSSVVYQSKGGNAKPGSASILKDMAWRQLQSTRRRDQGQRSQAKQDDREHVLPFFTIVGCAAVACGIAAGISNIVDVVKTRWQTSILSTTDETSSTRRIATQLFRQGGFGSFTRGMGARIMWMVPSVTISMSTFEWLKAHGFAEALAS
ncbi:hypothetical protein BGX33_003289 [Mortierella sp. NVP41]|nr:hypothetical protein BGX33_003289 [Mortierella sp. NVP41]